MKNGIFDPSRAVEVGDPDADEELDSLMGNLDAKLKNLRYRVIDEAFKEIVATAKRERAALMEEMKKLVETKLDEHKTVVESAAKGNDASLTAVKDSVAALKPVLTSIEAKAEEAVHQAKTASGGVNAIASRPSPTFEATPVDNSAVLAAIEKLATTHATKQAGKWNVVPQRDDYGNVKNYVITRSG